MYITKSILFLYLVKSNVHIIEKNEYFMLYTLYEYLTHKKMNANLLTEFFEIQAWTLRGNKT